MSDSEALNNLVIVFGLWLIVMIILGIIQYKLVIKPALKIIKDKLK